MRKKKLQQRKSDRWPFRKWQKGVRNHLYWCTTSTKQGFESLILAKWKSFICHVANKHDHNPDSLFTTCAHGVLDPHRWIKIGMYIVMNLYLTVLVAFVSVASCILYFKSSVK